MSKCLRLPVEGLRPVIQFAVDIDIRRQPGHQPATHSVYLTQRAFGGRQGPGLPIQREFVQGVL